MVALGVGTVYVTARVDRQRQSAEVPGIYSKVPEFQLTDRTGARFGSADLLGKVWVADFIYTTCPGPCPMVTGRLAELQDEFSGLEGVRLVTFTVNPEVDTPEQLDAYARSVGAAEGWAFLTGPESEVHDLIKGGFKLPVGQGGGEEPVLHSTKLVLVDQAGSIRGYYDAANPTELKALSADAVRLVKTGAQ